MDELYSILGVKNDATPAEIKKAHRKLIVKHHPDKNGGEASQEFLDTQKAYEILSNPKTRETYDLYGFTEADNKYTMLTGVAETLIQHCINQGIAPDLLINEAEKQLHASLSKLKELKKKMFTKDGTPKCAICGKPMEMPEATAAEVLFCPERGGVVCATCKTAGDYYISLSRESSVHLAALQKASLSEAAGVSIGYREVSCLLEALIKFVSYQTGVVSRLKSLEFLEKLENGYQANGKRSKQT